MSSKVFRFDDIGEVTIYKRKGTRKISLRVAGGKVRVTQPYWLPYQAGIAFAQKQTTWIDEQRNHTAFEIQNGQVVGKRHTVRFVAGDTLTSRVQANVVRVVVPWHMTHDEPTVQNEARKALKRALTTEAKSDLPPLLRDLAQRHGFTYKSVRIKSMRSRWGSCTNEGAINLNCYLMQLPWDCIEYVLLHELVHTKHMNHGEGFWQTMRHHMPDVDARRKAIKSMKTDVFAMQ